MKLEYIACGIIIFIVCYVAYKIYEFCYYRSDKFKIIKNKAEKYVNECNELNEYIEYLKNSLLSNSNIENGVSHFTDTSRFNYKRPQYNKIRFAPHICNCSRTVCDGSRKRPFQYLCKYFNIRAVEEDLSKLEQMLINFESVEDGMKKLINEKKKILTQIKLEVPIFIYALGEKTLVKKVGFDRIDFNTVYFPRYIFRYVSPGGNASYENYIELNIETLNKLINYLSELIKFRQSIAGQRALMTSKLRKEILKRDNYTCQVCGNSTYNEPNLLLEIDHKLPLSKGGITSEDNLQVLCWRCNRHKGNKVL